MGIALLPSEVLHAIFLYLGPIDLFRVDGICREWRSFLQDQGVWKNLYFKCYRIGKEKIENGHHKQIIEGRLRFRKKIEPYLALHASDLLNESLSVYYSDTWRLVASKADNVVLLWAYSLDKLEIQRPFQVYPEYPLLLLEGSKVCYRFTPIALNTYDLRTNDDHQGRLEHALYDFTQVDICCGEVLMIQSYHPGAITVVDSHTCKTKEVWDINSCTHALQGVLAPEFIYTFIDDNFTQRLIAWDRKKGKEATSYYKTAHHGLILLKKRDEMLFLGHYSGELTIFDIDGTSLMTFHCPSTPIELSYRCGILWVKCEKGEGNILDLTNGHMRLLSSPGAKNDVATCYSMEFHPSALSILVEKDVWCTVTF